jgi:hypothetical protein
MGPPSYMRSVVDRKDFMRRMTVNINISLGILNRACRSTEREANYFHLSAYWLSNEEMMVNA